MICKMRSWAEGMELEGDTIRALREKLSSIPVPELVYSWLDRAWDRTFVLYKRPPGDSLEDAWPKLSPDQVLKIAADVAAYAKIMIQLTSPRLETITGCALHSEDHLLGERDRDFEPKWLPFMRPIFTAETLRTHLRDLGNEDPPRFGDTLYFYHSLMVPEYVFVSVSGPEEKDVQVAAILIWDFSGYYPHWWMAIKT